MSDDTVHRLPNANTDEPQGHVAIVSFLEELIRRAKAGDIVHIGAAWVDANGDPLRGLAIGPDCTYRTLGTAIGSLSHRYYEKIDATGHTTFAGPDGPKEVG